MTLMGWWRARRQRARSYERVTQIMGEKVERAAAQNTAAAGEMIAAGVRRYSAAEELQRTIEELLKRLAAPEKNSNAS